MDKIQKILIKLGHKDLAQQYYLKIAGWWKIDNVENGQVDFDQPKKKNKLINAIPGNDSKNILYNGDGPADTMGECLDKIIYKYESNWKRKPYREELEAVFNFVTNGKVKSKEIKKLKK